MNQGNQKPVIRHGQGLTEVQLRDLIAEVEEKEMLRAPVDFKRSVMEKAKRPDVQLVIKTQKLSRGMELFFYSLKIGVAAAMAVAFLFLMPMDAPLTEYGLQSEFVETDSPETLSEIMDKKVDAMTVQIRQLAEDWMNKED